MVKILDWPSCSPVLNPIENFWQIVKSRVALYEIGNFEDLFNATKSACESIPQSRFEKLVEFMPRRCQAVIENRGFETKS